MSNLPAAFRRFVPQLLHMVIMPIFFFGFLLLYRPIDAQNLLGNTYFGVHITLLSCVVLVCTIMVRLLYYFLPMKLNYSLYIFWCLGEMIYMSFFVALYIWLVLHKNTAYLEILTASFQLIFMTLIIPYVIVALSLRIHEYHEKSMIANEPLSQKRIRFYDQKHNLKLVVTPSDLIYISSDENYINIYYNENGKLRNYVLRSSMKAIEEVCIESGLVRCHRSYLINPVHVKVLRKDQEGVVYAELDAPEVQHIPVTKRYYASVSSLL